MRLRKVKMKYKEWLNTGSIREGESCKAINVKYKENVKIRLK